MFLNQKFESLASLVFAVVAYSLPAQAERGLQIVSDCPGPGCPANTTAIDGANPIANLPVDLQLHLQVKFDSDSTGVSENSTPLLNNLCSALKNSDFKILVIGHTDSQGSESYNLALSQKRAEAVVGYLVSDCGINVSRLRAIGLGETYLLDPENPEGAANRRVEFQAVETFDGLK